MEAEAKRRAALLAAVSALGLSLGVTVPSRADESPKENRYATPTDNRGGSQTLKTQQQQLKIEGQQIKGESHHIKGESQQLKIEGQQIKGESQQLKGQAQ